MRPLSIVVVVLLLTSPAALAQKGVPKTQPKRIYKPFGFGPNVSGGTGPIYHPPTMGGMPFTPHYYHNFSTAMGGMSLGMRHGPLLQAGDPWWYLRERRIIEGISPWDPLRDPELAPFMFPDELLIPALGRSPFVNPTQLLIRQMLRPSELSLLGLNDHDLFFAHMMRGRTGMVGIPGGPMLDFGLPPTFGMMSPYGVGSPMDRFLPGGARPGRVSIMPQMAPYLPPGFLPDTGRFSITGGKLGNRYSNYGLPTMPNIPGFAPRYGVPYPVGPRFRPLGQGTAPAPLPAPVVAKELTDEERKVLNGFDKELTSIVDAARGKDWAKLDVAIRKVNKTPDIPDALKRDLTALDAAAKELAGCYWLRELRNERVSNAMSEQPGLAQLGIVTLLGANVESSLEGHIVRRCFDIQVHAADIERVGKLVARIAAPAKKPSDATPAAVEQLLGRSLTGVETLLLLHMRADHRSAEEVATELKKTR